MDILSVSDITLSYENQIVINNLSFSVEKGDYVVIVGENGSGKSSLMMAVMGLKDIDKGTIINNSNTKKIGYLQQQKEFDINFPASVKEVVKSGRLNRKGFLSFYDKEDDRKLKESLERLNISHLANKSFCNLSGGEKQKVLLARAICATDELLFLDEPVTGLDSKSTEIMYEEILNLNIKNNITVLMISHDIKSSLKYANKVLYIGDNEYFFGTKEDFKKKYKF